MQWKGQQFWKYFLIICRYLNLVENQRIISDQSEVATTLIFWTDYGKNRDYMLFPLNVAWNWVSFVCLKEK